MRNDRLKRGSPLAEWERGPSLRNREKGTADATFPKVMAEGWFRRGAPLEFSRRSEFRRIYDGEMCARADITSQAIRKFLQYRASRYGKR